MLIFDTSAFINGQRHHLPPGTFPGVWKLIGQYMRNGQIIAPRAVRDEIERQTDEIADWIQGYSDAFVDPSPEIQRRVGEVQAHKNFPNEGTRHEADPWVVAEALVREWAVVTYEGRAFSGRITERAMEKIPGVCKAFEIKCVTLPEALTTLGGTFDLR